MAVSTWLATGILLLTLATEEAASLSPTERQFFSACRSNNVAAVRSIVVDDINVREAETGQSALMASVLAGATDVVKLLLSDEFKADASVPEKDGYTPMHGAGFQGRAKIASLLLGHGLDVDDVHSGDGLTPLWRTTWGRDSRHIATARVMILQGKADVNFAVSTAAPGHPHNVLASAVQRGNINMVSLLLKQGADPNSANPNDGNTALHLAVKSQVQPNIIKLLIELGGGDISLKNKDGETVKELIDKLRISL